MRNFKVVALLIVLCASLPLAAQRISQEERIRRLEVNRSYFADWDYWPNLRERARSTNGDVVLSPVINEQEFRCTTCTNESFDDLGVKRATKQSDIVVTGRVLSNISSLNSKESFIITDSQFAIDTVLKGNPKSVEAGSEITILTPGGVVRSDGHLLKAYLPNISNLKIGDSYVFFLKYLPSSNSYVPVGLEGFNITADHVVPLHTTVQMPAAEFVNDIPSFIAALTSSILQAGTGGAR